MPPWMYAEKQPCGTTAAYDRHIKHNEPACRACRQANARRWREQNPPKSERTRRAHAAAGGTTGWEPGMAVDVLALLDICEAIEPGWDREAAMGDAF